MGKSWKNPHKVAAAAKKGALFTKLAREISVSAKLGSPDPDANSRLKLAIQVAREASCPKETIERAIKKGSGQLDDGTQIDEVTYEGYGPHGVGVIVECQTDNKVRTVSEIRNLFKKLAFLTDSVHCEAKTSFFFLAFFIWEFYLFFLEFT